MIAPLLNERTSKKVWDESQKLVDSMVGTLQSSAKVDTKAQAFETDAAINGVRGIAINVLGAVGYGDDFSWGEANSKIRPGFKLSYIESISLVCEHLVAAALLPAKLLTSPIMPTPAQKIGYALQDFPRYVEDVIKAERASTNSNSSFVSAMIKASDEGKVQSDVKAKVYLNEDEFAGTLFQVTIAGYDTTANTLAYALANLALYPEWQDWIIEEIDREAPAGASHEYEKTYPRLKRVMALMVSQARLHMKTQWSLETYAIS